MPGCHERMYTTVEAAIAPQNAAKGRKVGRPGTSIKTAVAASPAPAVTPTIVGAAKGFLMIP